MVSSTSIVRNMSTSRCAIAIPIAIALAPTSGRAEVQVRGTLQAVVIEAQNATVEETVVALGAKFKIQFRSAVNLDRQLNGTFEGTLQQALSRILRGYNFIVKSGQGGLEITMLGAGKPVFAEGSPATKSVERDATAAKADNANRPVLAPAAETMPAVLSMGGAGPIATPPPPGAAPWVVPQMGQTLGPVPTPPVPGTSPSLVPQVREGRVVDRMPMPPRPGEAG
jgi:hypothetical protein